MPGSRWNDADVGSNGSTDIQPRSTLDDLGPGIRRDEREVDGIVRIADRVLDRRLRRDSARPIAVALSGGGDSVALALMADGWAREAGRDLLILTVDHRLQPASAG